MPPTAELTPLPLPEAPPFPNNPRLPLLLYTQAFDPPRAETIEATFAANGWPPAWRYGIFSFHHYHSTAHEVLGCFRGWAHLQFGGPEGPVVTVAAGDVAILPAGAAHKCRESGGGFRCVGAYPAGSAVDMQEGESQELAAAAATIAAVPLPAADPVYGAAGALRRYWEAGANAE